MPVRREAIPVETARRRGKGSTTGRAVSAFAAEASDLLIVSATRGPRCPLPERAASWFTRVAQPVATSPHRLDVMFAVVGLG